MAATTAEVRRSLAGGAGAPPLDTLLRDFATYHVAMVWLGGAVTVGLLTTAVVLWRPRASAPRAERLLRLLLLTTLCGVLALTAFFGVVTAARVSPTARAAPALLAFFEGAD